MLSLSCPGVSSMSKTAFDLGQLVAPCGSRCPSARAAPRRRRTPCACFVASLATAQPGTAAVDVPARTIPAVTTASAPERISVSSLLEVVSDDLLSLNNNLKSLVGAENPVLVSAAEQIFGAGGKRLRPALVFLVSRATAELSALSELTTEHQRLAEIIEMIHTASLIHDDVIDDSGMRRGKETIHQLYGTRVAVLAGDFMFAQSSWFLANLENIEVIKLISQVIKDFASGEIKQASTLFDCDVTLDDYLLKSYYKTASLIAASTRSAAIFSGVDTTICEQMYEYGRNLGLSFQVVDDILDFTQSAEQLGKPAGSDLAKGNLTAPVIFALRDEPRLREIIDSEFSEPGSLAAAVELVHRSCGIRRAQELAEEKGELAIQSLQCLPRSEFRSALERVVHYNLQRIQEAVLDDHDVDNLIYIPISHRGIYCWDICMSRLISPSSANADGHADSVLPTLRRKRGARGFRLAPAVGREIRPAGMQQDQRKKTSAEADFFTDYGDANRYKIQEVIGKGSYGVVCSAIDLHTRQRVAIKKIHNIFEHVSDAARILREIKLLRLLRHPDVVEIKHIMLPPSRKDFKDIYVVFELMESDLHQVIKANDDLTKEHYQFFLYQLLRALKYIHTANVYHRDLKPKNILANSNCKLKICDFGLARVAFNDTPTTVFWTDYVATRWYRAPELCGSFFSKYTPAIDIWSIGCIFAEVLTGKPLFPGKNVVHQLDLMTDLLGTPSMDTISRVRNEKARRYLSSMRKKDPVPFSQKFPSADPLALKLLEKLLAFDPKDRPTAEEALRDPYFKGLARVEREPSCQPIRKVEFDFEHKRMSKEEIRELIFREMLEYHPQLLNSYINGTERTTFLYPSAVDQFKKQFSHLEESGGNGPSVPTDRKHASLPRTTVVHSNPIPAKEQPLAASSRVRPVSDDSCKNPWEKGSGPGNVPRPSLAPQGLQAQAAGSVRVNGSVMNSGYPHQQIPQAYGYRQMPARLDSTMGGYTQQSQAYACANIKGSPDVAVNMRAPPFHLPAGPKNNPLDRIASDTDIYTRSLNGIVAAAAASVGAGAHRNVGVVPSGMSRMY
ncbi:mitogen-activated protein kinase 10-like [Miscanthus floridulus]|uniref:mitogen-activated protein kinase 10-like n=1 Tax=Miscanthus floridulus TaxID=154761 RepID=UPI00345A1F12